MDREHDRGWPLDLGSELRSCFGATALGALDRAASLNAPGLAVDTLGVFLALIEVDAAAAWDRIWLEFGELQPSATGRYLDPRPEAGERWNGRPLTGTCAQAIRAAVLLADGSDLLPASAGVLALCLVGEPTTAASRALAATSGHAHAVLLDLVQEALVGGSWRDIGSVLHQCFEQAAGPHAPADEDPDLRRFADDMAEQFEALLEVLNQFLFAGTPAESGRLLEQHPELLGAQVDKVLAKLLKDAEETGDEAGLRWLRERRGYLDNYRRLTGQARPEDGPVQRYGECQPADHIMAHSTVEEPGYMSTAFRCELCHVGYLIDMTAAEGGGMHVDYFVFPADGCDAISPEITMWAVATCEGSLGDLEKQGVPVQRSTPVIGLRPDSLRRHTRFIRDS
jgi:hypothetical protein